MFKKSLLKKIAKKEKVEVAFLEKKMQEGKVVILLNKKRQNAIPVAIGEGLQIKINTNIGTSSEKTEISDELKKLSVAIKYGTDTIMDLSTGGNLSAIRKKIIEKAHIPVGSVPIYEVAYEVERRKGSMDKMTLDDILDVITQQAKDGIDFFTLHAGILKKTVSLLRENRRTGGIVSRGGAILARWMYVNNKENPLYENFDLILDILKKYNVTVSLGDALRPGAIDDSTDSFQLQELYVLSQLVKKCRKKGVQVMVEGPGHIKINEIAYNVFLEKKLCKGAPFYILGPLTIDSACGYDHITSAIGASIAALAGADFICVVTPAEHLRHPNVEDIKLGVMAAKIAARSVDVLKFPHIQEEEKKMSLYRAKRDWEKMFQYALDPEKAKRYLQKVKKDQTNVCTMCGKFCSLKLMETCKLLR